MLFNISEPFSKRLLRLDKSFIRSKLTSFLIHKVWFWLKKYPITRKYGWPFEPSLKMCQFLNHMKIKHQLFGFYDIWQFKWWKFKNLISFLCKSTNNPFFEFQHFTQKRLKHDSLFSGGSSLYPEKSSIDIGVKFQVVVVKLDFQYLQAHHPRDLFYELGSKLRFFNFLKWKSWLKPEAVKFFCKIHDKNDSTNC